jgi:ParB-like chromosome segregation protein Spo0J
MTLIIHPLANIFPYMEKAAFADLVTDIAQHGAREPIWLYEGAIIDGRHRYKAAQKAGVECPTREYVGSDPLGFVLSLNLNRRHLNESQRAMVAANLANIDHGGNRKTDQTANLRLEVTQKNAAEKLNISERTVAAAVKINKMAIPELAAEVANGNISINAASQIAKLSEAEQKDIVAAGPAAIKEATRRIKAAMQAGPVEDANIDAAEVRHQACSEPAQTPAIPNDMIVVDEETYKELVAACKEMHEENLMMMREFDADDRIKTALDEIRRYKALTVNAERTLAAKSDAFVERANLLRHWKNRAKKAEKELAKLKC